MSFIEPPEIMDLEVPCYWIPVNVSRRTDLIDVEPPPRNSALDRSDQTLSYNLDQAGSSSQTDPEQYKNLYEVGYYKVISRAAYSTLLADVERENNKCRLEVRMDLH